MTNKLLIIISLRQLKAGKLVAKSKESAAEPLVMSSTCTSSTETQCDLDEDDRNTDELETQASRLKTTQLKAPFKHHLKFILQIKQLKLIYHHLVLVILKETTTKQSFGIKLRFVSLFIFIFQRVEIVTHSIVNTA